MLELALWKAKMNGSKSNNTRGRRKKMKIDEQGLRNQCRISCGSDIVIQHVLPYLLPANQIIQKPATSFQIITQYLSNFFFYPAPDNNTPKLYPRKRALSLLSRLVSGGEFNTAFRTSKMAVPVPVWQQAGPADPKTPNWPSIYSSLPQMFREPSK